MKELPQRNEMENLLKELTEYFSSSYFPGLRRTKKSQFPLHLDSLDKIQCYDLSTWSKAFTYLLGKEVIVQDYQTIVEILNNSTCP